MSDNKKAEQKRAPETKEKKLVNPGDIVGKIDVRDDRERRDGPGGN